MVFFFLGGGDLGEKDWEGRRGARDSGNISREGGGVVVVFNTSN